MKQFKVSNSIRFSIIDYRSYPTRLILLHVGAWDFLTGAKAVRE